MWKVHCDGGCDSFFCIVHTLPSDDTYLYRRDLWLTLQWRWGLNSIYSQVQRSFKFVKVKIKQSHNRPGVAQRVPGGLGSQISWHSARVGGEVVSLKHRPPLSPGMFLVLIFTLCWVDPRAMVGSEGNMSLTSPVAPLGIDPGTVRLVAQRLNHYAKLVVSFNSFMTVNGHRGQQHVENYRSVDWSESGIEGLSWTY
jgi:hypothetical protein